MFTNLLRTNAENALKCKNAQFSCFKGDMFGIFNNLIFLPIYTEFDQNTMIYRGLYYKTFYGRNLLIFVISQGPTLEWSYIREYKTRAL
jgi:hypothetical protein